MCVFLPAMAMECDAAGKDGKREGVGRDLGFEVGVIFCFRILFFWKGIEAPPSPAPSGL